MDRILITGKNSNSGKTTVTCAIIAALVRRGYDVGAFKCGPDYIDPMFHRAMGVSSYNLDPYFLSEGNLRSHFAAHAKKINIIEGVMGFYDGIAGTREGSTYTVAQILQTPVIYAEGLLPYDERLKIPHRHLGLVTDFAQNKDLFENFADAGESLDIDGLFKLAQTAPMIQTDKQGTNIDKSYVKTDRPDIGADIPDIEAIKHIIKMSKSNNESNEPSTNPPCHARIAVSRDKAFCFMYNENLELMRTLGAEIVPFSPLADTSLPERINALFICGGYPEAYADILKSNVRMCESIQNAVASGMPTIAECGGFIYLHYAGVFKAEVLKRDRLQRFGYVEITAKRDNLLCKAGESIRSHEFHYYDSGDCGSDFSAVKPISLKAWDCIHTTDTLYAGFPHLYFPANPVFAENFIKGAINYTRL